MQREASRIYFFPFFFFLFLSEVDVPVAAVCDAVPPSAAGVAEDVAADTAVAACVAVEGACAGSGTASCKGRSEPAMAKVIALLKISRRPRMAEERVRYLIVVMSSVTLRVRLCVDGRDLMR